MAYDALGLNKTDTLAVEMASGATSGTLTSGNFGTPTGRQVLIIDYDVPAKIEEIICNISGTALSSITRSVAVTHAAGAKVLYTNDTTELYTYLKTQVTEGWTKGIDTWTYATATTFTIAGINLTTVLNVGDKIRLKQGGSYKYFYVTAVSFSTDTTVTITGGSDYTLANAAITDNYYSKAATPNGFPTMFAYTSTINGFSSLTTQITKFAMEGKKIYLVVALSGTSNSTTFNFTLPITPSANSGFTHEVRGINNSAATLNPAYIAVVANTLQSDIYLDNQGGAWTASGSKEVRTTLTYYMD